MTTPLCFVPLALLPQLAKASVTTVYQPVLAALIAIASTKGAGSLKERLVQVPHWLPPSHIVPTGRQLQDHTLLGVAAHMAAVVSAAWFCWPIHTHTPPSSVASRHARTYSHTTCRHRSKVATISRQSLMVATTSEPSMTPSVCCAQAGTLCR